jgi:hypothetical protein
LVSGLSVTFWTSFQSDNGSQNFLNKAASFNIGSQFVNETKKTASFNVKYAQLIRLGCIDTNSCNYDPYTTVSDNSSAIIIIIVSRILYSIIISQ